MGTLPIFTALIAAAARVERLRVRFAVASLVSFAGVALVAIGSERGGGGSVSGNLLMVGTAASWAAYSVAIAPLMQRYSPYRISSFVLIAVCLPLLAVGSVQIADQDWSLGTVVWAGAVFAILGPIVLTNVLWFTAISRVGPSRATLVANLQPFLAAVFALAILSEEMTWVQVAGGAAIAGGIALARRQRVVSQAPPAE
jgi:drug/metabolite transporter (DMT)-like permease